MSGTCRICGSRRTTPWLECGEWRYSGCTECSAVWLDPLPGDDWAENFYDLNYFLGGRRGGYTNYAADESRHRSNAAARVKLARQFGAAPLERWLDIGCALGFTLDEARKAGFTAVGVELSAWARTVARERFGLEVFATLREARREMPGGVDVVSFFQALEHVHDPAAALDDARACLRTNGLLLVETWDRGSKVARLFGRHWQQIMPPSVLWLLDRKSLAFAIERAGFRVRTILRTSKAVSVGWALRILADKEPGIFAPALRALEHSSIRKIGFTYGLGDLVTVVAVAQGDITH